MKADRNNGDRHEDRSSWLITYADMMTLLLTFFVVLLSLSEIDSDKYEHVATSVKRAFGTYSHSGVDEVPPVDETPHDLPEPHELRASKAEEERSPPARRGEHPLFERIKQKLSTLIKESLITVEETPEHLTIRLREEGNFPKGSATLSREAIRRILAIRDALKGTPGTIHVSGHTDDTPVRVGYASNWSLSAARAVSVVHQLLKGGVLDKGRLVAQGFGDTHPLVANTDRKSKAKNRRVEISVHITGQGAPRRDLELQ